MLTRLQQLYSLGQAIWLDFISRDLIRSGRVHELVDEGVAGMTSNPTIFHKAIAKSSDYDEQIRDLAEQGLSAQEIYESIAVQDVSDAADALRSVYNETHGRDGYVSLEVRPALAHDTDGTIQEARRLYAAVNRPNVMIKVPATEAGLPAVAALIGEGVNVNVTLIFSVAMYERVINAYLEGLRRFRDSGMPLSNVSSVASFFISRLDSLVDKLLGERVLRGDDGVETLLGHAAVANAKVAYQRYREVFEGDRFAPLRAEGARVQRPLWASTSTKNPAYPDTKYVDTLIGVNTVNTVPPETLDAIRDHGVVAQTIEQDVSFALSVMDRLRDVQLDMKAVTDQLLAEGVKSFADSFDALIASIEEKRAKFAVAKAG